MSLLSKGFTIFPKFGQVAPAVRPPPALSALASWYRNNQYYRQIGLRHEDLIPEESAVVQLALSRLPPSEAYDRLFRIRRAIQLSIQHQVLPKDEQTTDGTDKEYLSPFIAEIEAEIEERKNMDAMIVEKKK